MNKTYLKLLVTSLLVFGGTGCDVGESGGQDVAEGGIEGTGRVATSNTSVGTITGFGSVFVNGVEYETDNADVETDDNDNATEDDLEIGMLVTIQGNVNEDAVTGDALFINYSEDIKGYVQAIDVNAGTLIIMGQEVTTDELTVYDNVTLETFLVGDFVEVSGLTSASGVLLATRIEKETATVNSVIKIKGVISDLDTLNTSFSLGHLTVDYSSAEMDLGDDVVVLADGAVVKVKGSQVGVDTPLIAIKVEIKGKEYEAQEGHSLELDGVIESFVSVTSFTVNGQSITTNDATEYEHGASSFLVLGERVKVKGDLNSEDQLVADEIEFHQDSDFEVEGTVEAVNLEAKTVTVLGVTLVVNEQTLIDDDTASNIRFFNITDISVGDFVEIKGFANNGVLIATKLERDDDIDDEVELRGLATAIDRVEFTFTLSGVVIHTSSLTEFESASGESVDQATFFSNLEENTNIKIDGSVINGQVEAVEVEVKDEDEREDGADESEISGLVSSVSETGFTLLHYTIELSDTTEFEVVDVSLSLADFLAQLQVGDEVEIEGLLIDNVITATSVEIESEEEDGE
jgi:hypothetical protein